VIDGSSVPDEGIRIVSLPENVESIVLASDGYLILKGTLEESEQALAEVLNDDPLLFRKYKATKGMKSGQVSFDDRTYIKLLIQK
jgi:glycerophosphoryl diester phosphodiesterase